MRTKNAIAAIACLGLAACSTQTANRAPTAQATQNATAHDLRFDPSAGVLTQVQLGDQTLQVRAFENVVYVANPTDAVYQSMNVYIPEAYFHGQSLNGYNAQNAPIFMPNAVGGYMPAKPMQVGKGRDGQPNSLAHALHRGMIVASAGARGRTLQDEQGHYYGKAPMAIVDLKAAVRYLKANDAFMPGDAQKIVVNGTSAGGAMTALLGATGNSQDYDPYLQQAGALAGDDSVFAVSSYCPITNLENADMAYEWQLSRLVHYKKMSINTLDYNVKRELVDATLSADEQRVAQSLKAQFPAYLNRLALTDKQGNPLRLDPQGEGSFKDELLRHLNLSVQQAAKQGVDLSAYRFLAKNANGDDYIADYDAFLRDYVGRSKGAPAFDALDLSSGENNLFGDKTTDNRHFSAFGTKNSVVQNAKTADPLTVKTLNPMAYLLGQENVRVAHHWRIRHGAKDSDTGFAVPLILASALSQRNKNVDFAMPWDQGHGGDYDLSDLFAWIDGVAKAP